MHSPPNSDHALIKVTLSTPNWHKTTQTITKIFKDTSRADWNKFQTTLEETLSERNLASVTDIDRNDALLLYSIQQSQSVSIPQKLVKISNNPHYKPLPAYILNIMKIKRRAHRLYMFGVRSNIYIRIKS